MQHPNLKNLIWGSHLTRLMHACGASLKAAEPTPKLIGKIPLWFQRVSALLTLLGLIGAIRMLDRAISPRPDGSAREAEVAALDASGWNMLASGSFRNRMTGAWPGQIDERPVVLSLTDPDSLGSPEGSTEDQEPGGGLARGGGAGNPVGAFGPGTAPAALPHRFQRIEVTAYCSRRVETDSTPTLTATSTKTAPGTIALSRDLLRTFTEDAPFDFGDKVMIPGVGIFDVRDTMNPRWTEKADIWVDSVQEAREWGKRTVFVTRLDRHAPEIAGRP